MIEGHSTRAEASQTIANRRNAFWGFAEYVAQAISLVCLTPILLKHLGDSAYGTLVIASTIMGLNGLFSVGLGPATQHYVAQYRASNRPHSQLVALVDTSIISNFLLGLVTCVVLLLLTWLGPQLTGTAPTDALSTVLTVISLGAIAMPFVFVTSSVENILRGFEKFNLAVPIKATTSLLSTAGQIALVLAGATVIHLILLLVIGQMLQAIAGFLLVRMRVIPGDRLVPKFSAKEFRRFIGYGVYVWTNSLLATLRHSGETLLLATVLGPGVLTLYVIPARVLSQIHLLLSKVYAYLFPFATKLVASGNAKQLANVYTDSTRQLSTLSGLMIPSLAIACGPILAVWLGNDKARDITPIFQILSLRYAVFPLSILSSNLLLAANKTRVMAAIMAVNTITIVPASVLLAMLFGVKGAAFAQLLVFVPILFNRYYIEKTLLGSASLRSVALPIVFLVVPLTLLLIFLPVPSPNSIFTTAIVAAVCGLACGSLCWFGNTHFVSNNMQGSDPPQMSLTQA